jgi:hypothetical protein
MHKALLGLFLLLPSISNSIETQLTDEEKFLNTTEKIFNEGTPKERLIKFQEAVFWGMYYRAENDQLKEENTELKDKIKELEAKFAKHAQPEEAKAELLKKNV